MPLARAYAVTGDEKYAREWVAQLKSWAEAWPVAPHVEQVDPDMRFAGDHWRSIEAGIRIYCVWLPLLPYFRRSPSWDEEGWITFLKLIHDHGEFLVTHYSNHKRCGNWLTMEATALFQLGVMFPELNRSAQWRQLGYRRVTHEVRYQFDHHGGHMERTPSTTWSPPTPSCRPTASPSATASPYRPTCCPYWRRAPTTCCRW